MANFFGTPGNNVINGTSNDDVFDLSQGGQDTAFGNGGNDRFVMGGALDAGDKLDGGTGYDTVVLKGNYSAGLTLGATTVTSIEAFQFTSGYNYKLTTNDANVAAGRVLFVNGSALSAANSLIFDGSAETDGSFLMTGGAGSDTLSGGANTDVFGMQAGGVDTVRAGGGLDIMDFGASFTAADSVDGGTGFDTLFLKGNYSAGVVFGANTLTNVELLWLHCGYSYKITTHDATVAPGASLFVNGAFASTLTFDGSAETDGTFTLFGSCGADRLTGGAGDDTMFLFFGGNDIANGGGGNDEFQLGGAFTAADQIDGGAGDEDTLILHGNYSAGLVFGPTTLTNVEFLILRDGYSYNLTTHDATVGAGQKFHVDASDLGPSRSLTFNGLAETDGHFFVTAGNGVDTITGGAVADTLTMNDDLTAADRLDGRGGSDTIILDGDYSAGLTLGATTVLNVEAFSFVTGHSYRLTTNDATVAAGESLTVMGAALASGDSLIFNGSAETNGRFSVFGGAGPNDVTTGTGNDTFNFDGYFKASDHIDGDGGTDTLILTGDYSAGVVLAATTLVSVENIRLNPGFSYNLTTSDATVAAGGMMVVIADTLGAGDSLTFDGSAETDGRFVINGGSGANNEAGGAGADILNGGSGNDVLAGGLDADQLISGGGADIFEYGGSADSTSTSYDDADGFDASTDAFDVPWSVTGVDPTITSGHLSSVTFDADLAAAVNASTLDAFHAVLFTPTTGGLAGHTYLVIDGNGTAGYQSGDDIVVELTNASNLGSLTTSNFI